MEVGDGAPNIEADQKSAFNNVQVGDGGPNTENFVKKNSTGNIS